MNYTDKLTKIKGNLPNLENKSKEDLLKFIEIIIDMSLSREEANQHIDGLLEIAHKKEIESWRRLSAQITGEFTEEISKLEKAAGYQLDDLVENLRNGELKIIEGE